MRKIIPELSPNTPPSQVLLIKENLDDMMTLNAQTDTELDENLIHSTPRAYYTYMLLVNSHYQTQRDESFLVWDNSNFQKN